MSPEDIERIRHSLGLDKPLVTQYLLWLKNILHGDLGYSLIYHRPVLEMILERIPATLGLMGASLLLSDCAGGAAGGCWPARLSIVGWITC